jgi:hypothetical protein
MQLCFRCSMLRNVSSFRSNLLKITTLLITGRHRFSYYTTYLKSHEHFVSNSYAWNIIKMRQMKRDRDSFPISLVKAMSNHSCLRHVNAPLFSSAKNFITPVPIQNWLWNIEYFRSMALLFGREMAYYKAHIYTGYRKYKTCEGI